MKEPVLQIGQASDKFILVCAGNLHIVLSQYQRSHGLIVTGAVGAGKCNLNIQSPRMKSSVTSAIGFVKRFLHLSTTKLTRQ